MIILNSSIKVLLKAHAKLSINYSSDYLLNIPCIQSKTNNLRLYILHLLTMQISHHTFTPEVALYAIISNVLLHRYRLNPLTYK